LAEGNSDFEPMAVLHTGKSLLTLVLCNSKKFTPKISHKGTKLTENTEEEKTEESEIMNYFFSPCFFVSFVSSVRNL